MKLPDDIATLRLFVLGEGVTDLYGVLDRIITIVEPLASLTPEQARMLVAWHTDMAEAHEASAVNTRADFRGVLQHEAATHRIASTIFSRLGES